MTNERNALSDLFSACQKDDVLKARFMNDPKAVLADHGIDVPEDVDVNVVQDSDTSMNITIPSNPPQTNELSDSELRQAAGGDSFAIDCETTGLTNAGLCFANRNRAARRRFFF